MANNVSEKQNVEQSMEDGSANASNGQVSQQNALDKEQEKLNAVRNLLFGQNVEEYRNEFEEVKKIIQNEKESSDQALAGLKEEINTRLDKIEKSLNTRLDQLDDSKTDRKQLANLLHDIANKLEA